MSEFSGAFRGKRALVTGGSSGIGLATARLLVKAGAEVWIVARGPERLEAARVELQALAGPGQRVGASQLDVSDLEACRALAPCVLEELGGLDLLVNNAGIAIPGYLHELPDEVFERTMAIDYFGTLNMTRAFLGHFMQQRAGHIANVSSTAGFLGVFGYAAYSPPKFAVAGLSEVLRQDLLPYGVGVSVLYPADTDTPQLAAENEIKPAETAAISGNVKPQSAEAVAAALLEGIAAGRLAIVPGAMNKLLWYLVRWAPWLVRMIVDRDLLKAWRQRKGG
jgi:3-dehydrosphinganine reductase